MTKRLKLVINGNSWTAVKAPWRKPCPFPLDQNTAYINFQRALLWIGISSVSIRMPNWWLASQWAQVRYVAAADHRQKDLCLHDAVDDIETHQKRVLSDDWGVGFALQWLSSKLHYRYVSHASFVMRDLQNNGIARYIKRNKSGPNKCPDFIALDRAGRFHLIECKGNQDSPKTTLSQFERGRQQKRNIRFNNETLVGQRLLTGVALAYPGGRWSTTLRVEDPPPDRNDNDLIGYYEINAELPGPIITSMQKATIINSLLSAGLFNLAHRAFPKETETEMAGAIQAVHRSTFVADDKEWIGQEYALLFPVPLPVYDGSEIRGATLRLGVAPSIVSRAEREGNDRQLRGMLIEQGTEIKPEEENVFEERSQAEFRPEEMPVEHEDLEPYAAIRRVETFIADMFISRV